MVSSLVTTTALEPVVVIIDDQSILAVWLEQFFLESGLAVCRTELSAVEATLTSIDQSGQEIYKILFLSGFTPQGMWLRDIFLNPQVIAQHNTLQNQTLELLQQRTEQIVCIIRQSSLDLSSFTTPALIELHKLLKQEQYVYERVRQLSNAQVFIGIDTLDYASEFELPLLYSILGITQNVLFNPENTWGLQTISAFYGVVANQLIKPHKAQVVLVSGVKKHAAYWLQKILQLHQRYFGTLPTLLSTPIEPPTLLGKQEYVMVQTNESCLEVLDVKTRMIPSLLKEIQEINQALLALDRSPIHLATKDIVTATRSTVSNPNSKGLDTHKIGSCSASTLDQQPNHSTTKNSHIYSNNSDNRLTDQSKNQYKPGESSEIVIEDWHERIKVTHPQEEPVDVTIEKPEVETERGVVYLDKELQNIFSQTRSKQLKQRSTTRVKTTKKLLFKTKRHRALFLSGIVLVGVGAVVGTAILLYSITVSQARKIVFHSLQNYTSSTKNEPITSTWVEFLRNQVVQYGRVVKEDMLESGSVLAEMAGSFNSLQAERSSGERNLQVWLKGMQGQEEYSLDQVNQEQQKSLITQATSWSSLLNLTDRVDVADLTTQQQSTLTSLRQIAQSNITAVAQINKFLEITPDLLGLKEKQVYAVLVQNDLELRPTGGFIQNVILLTFHRGVLTDYQVYSTYEIDNRLASSVKPPDEVKKVLGEQRWFLRDSNWNPDLPTTAKQVNWFLEDSLNRSVDGVVTIHYGVIRELLKAVGPLAIEQFNEEITDKNIYDKLEFHAEGKVADKTGKKLEYTSVVLTRLLEEIKRADKDKANQLFSVLFRGLEQKEMGMVVFAQKEAKTIKELGWDSSIITPRCPSQFLENTCIIDAIYQVDANVGINKVNAYIEKHVTDEVTLEKKIITHQRTISYTNTAKLDLWPQGTYRSYLKFLLPADALLQSVSINSTPVSSDQLSIYTENGRKIVAFLIEVGKQKNAVIKINYQLAHNFDKPFSYFLFGQKQPGEQKTGKAVIKLGEGMRARVVAPQPEIQGQELRFTLPEHDHLTVGVTVE